jgi:hypothetical protein
VKEALQRNTAACILCHYVAGHIMRTIIPAVWLNPRRRTNSSLTA